MCSQKRGPAHVRRGRVRVSAVFCVLQMTIVPVATAQMSRSGFSIAPTASISEIEGSDESAGWRFEVAPYLWAAGLNGRVGVLGQTADVDVSFREILKDLDFAIMLPAELRRGRWGIGAEVIYIKVSKDAAVPRPPVTDIDFEASQLLLELSPRYRVITRRAWAIDALAGVRFMSIDPTLTIEPQQLEFGKRRSWADPIVGASLIADVGRHWLGRVRADIGGFGVGSRLTWQALAVAGYRISNRVALAAGYRYLDMDYENGDDAFLYDVATRGPLLGVVIAFGAPVSRIR